MKVKILPKKHWSDAYGFMGQVVQLYSMFVNLVTKFQIEMFHEHHGLLDYVHESIALEH
jgi:hypothetical protein